MRRFLTISFFALALSALLSFAAYVWVERDFKSLGPSTADTVLIFPKGARLNEIAQQLEQAGVIRHRLPFMAGVYLRGMERHLQAGEYNFVAGASGLKVMEQLAYGRRVVRRLTVAEGLTVVEVQKLLLTTEGLTFGEPLPKVAEGSLLPETYFYSYGDTAASIQARMARSMEQALNEAWEKRKPGLQLKSADEVLILASIIEKETGKVAERPLVSAVFHNRLKQGIRLQADPTVAYGVTEGKATLGRDLTRADLNTISPWNTYQIDGLPKGPIANPGKASLLAATQPADVKDLYFVADGQGGHVFAETLDEHNRNVARWRKSQREGNSKE